MKIRTKTVISVFTLLILSVSASAQTKIFFNLDMRKALQDSLFVPPIDKVKLVGNMKPLNGYQTIYLSDTEPVDSIYTVEIDFPRRDEGKTLSYNFVLQFQNRTMEEQGTRNIKITGKEIELPPIQFGAFAW
ncbi:MAG: hypothetical protein JXR20_06730 [Balneola sp.]